MADNPSREQIAFAYDKYLTKHAGDKDAAMADLMTFMLGYSEPPAPDVQTAMVLDAPAMVGQSIFSAGMPWFVVVQQAVAEYVAHGQPVPTDVQIANFRALVESMVTPAA